MANNPTLAQSIIARRADLRAAWIEHLTATAAETSRGRISAQELEKQADEFLDCLASALRSASLDNLNDPAWDAVRRLLDDLSRQRVLSGFSSDETAMFVFTLKKPIFQLIREEAGKDADRVARDTWSASLLIDKLGLHTVRAFQKTREEVISRQQQELLELSTPVIKLWDGILALPMIGTLDSARTQIVMENLLQKIVETESEMAILDITGVPTVDTLVAQHLLKTVTALQLMGADCIISGVRPQIAQTIVHLGLDLRGVTTKASLADALSLALKRKGVKISQA